MTCGNPIKHEIQNVFGNWLDMLSIKKQLTDDQTECIQFGICNYSPRKVGEVPFFIFDLIYFIEIFAHFLVTDKGKFF